MHEIYSGHYLWTGEGLIISATDSGDFLLLPGLYFDNNIFVPLQNQTKPKQNKDSLE